MTEQAKAAKRAYLKKYYETHPEARERQKAYRKEWGKKPENKEKLKKHQEAYWERKGKEMAANENSNTRQIRSNRTTS